ncbi:MAG: bifunctional 3-deoxy-7-phosphoheptulonate synthase/chorismate mutase type II [Bacteroidales bacterium]|nr:bifunctional 3-deoxy-7-phosphoheptulonate synthase/chorismate mutase type II [Bacteroidales bacterium]
MKDIKLAPLEDWGLETERPLLISGPCSAETEEQVMETARRLMNTSTQVYRAGIWKPRTRPGTFEGVGVEGLKWLRRVKEETSLKTATEVANAKHVFEALKYQVDILWIGARTTVNPFAVQEIADALEGVDIPVMIKNPINPDVELWCGAIERISKAGINRIAAIHRGFSSYAETKYRNAPNWQLPIDLKRRRPDLPIICDPSHITGKHELLLEVSQRAMDLNFEGLIIESHINPKEAWSDARQQITPEELYALINNLVLRDMSTKSNSFMPQLEEYRSEIDRLDDELMQVLESRMKISEKIGECKKENSVTILQSGRWDSILEKSIAAGVEKNLSAVFVKKIFSAIHQESINAQTKIMNQ